jgi:hypothetical protein
MQSQVIAMKKNPPDQHNEKQDSANEPTTRRTAIKRIAAALSGVVAGAGIVGKAKDASAQTRYTSIGTIYGSSHYTSVYRDTVYGSYKPRYSSSYLSYYTSYRSHYSSVPPPYSSRYSSSRR